MHAAVEVCGAWRTLVTVYDASSLEPVGHVSRSTNPSSCGTSEGRRSVFEARAGATYLVAVDAADRAGAFALTLREANPPANDDFGDATDLGSSLPVSVEGSNAEGSLEPGAPSHGGLTGGESIWYRWTAPASEPIVVDTCGDPWAGSSAVAVYTGDAVDALAAVEATFQWCGSGWKRQLDAVAGTTYHIAVDTYFDTGPSR